MSEQIREAIGVEDKNVKANQRHNRDCRIYITEQI